MILHLDPTSPLPPYEQLRAQIATMAATGVLPPLTRLPSIRQLARDLGLATATVARAFRELERDGVIETRGRHGTYVCEASNSAPSVDSEQRLAEAAQAFAVQAAARRRRHPRVAAGQAGPGSGRGPLKDH